MAEDFFLPAGWVLSMNKKSPEVWSGLFICRVDKIRKATFGV